MAARFGTRYGAGLMPWQARGVGSLPSIAMMGQGSVMASMPMAVSMTRIQLAMTVSMPMTLSMMASMQKAHRNHHSEANSPEPKENLVDEHVFINATRFRVKRLRDFTR
jgi:hypothetical protein